MTSLGADSICIKNMIEIVRIAEAYILVSVIKNYGGGASLSIKSEDNSSECCLRLL